MKYYEDLSPEIPEMTIYEYMLDQNKEEVEYPALEYFGKTITYNQLFAQIDLVTKALIGIGVKKGDIVAVMMPNMPENIQCIYALSRIGAIADLIVLNASDDLLQHYLKESEARTMIACEVFVERITTILPQTTLENLIVVSPTASLNVLAKGMYRIKNRKPALPSSGIWWDDFLRKGSGITIKDGGSSGDVISIFHTSGTTGVPKGVMMTNRNYNAMAISGKALRLGFRKGGRMMNQVPPFLAYNTIVSMHFPLTNHMTIVLFPEYRPDIFAKNVCEHKINHVAAGPADWENFLDYLSKAPGSTDVSFLCSMMSGSDTLNAKKRKDIDQILEQHGCKNKVMEGYGMTEIGSAACVNMHNAYKENSMGVPFLLTNFCIFDNENKEELGYNQVGEICMSGPAIMVGYYNNEEETRSSLVEHADGTTWLHSGDLGYIDEDGFVFLEGRLKRMIIRFDGQKVIPFSVEKVILKIEGVKECCVIGSKDPHHEQGQMPVAYIVIEDELENDEKRAFCKKIVQHVNETLPEKEKILDVRVIDKLPLTKNGKVDFRALEKNSIEE